VGSAAERKPPLDQEPTPRGTKDFTDYKPQPPERVRDEVVRVAGNGSFVSRCLLVVSRDGESKNFETITGQDGLTFGITDFATNGGVHEFMRMLQKHYPDDFKAVFSEHAGDLLNENWIRKNNGGGKGIKANNNGLIRQAWVRTGVDRILSDRRFHGLQLENFKRGKVTPSLERFEKEGFDYEFTLAAMIGVANSAGASGMRSFLDAAKKTVPDGAPDRELAIAKRMLLRYVAGDPHPGADDLKYLGSVFDGKPPVTRPVLGHRGRRVRELVEKFPLETPKKFERIGEFALDQEERLKN
jgi:hypothetical protein